VENKVTSNLICPSLQKKKPFKGKQDMKPTRAYIAWDDNDISSSDSESGEQVNLALMMSHHSDDEEDELVITKTLMMIMMYKKQLKNYSRLKSKKID
jgi:hypothetical protein